MADNRTVRQKMDDFAMSFVRDFNKREAEKMKARRVADQAAKAPGPKPALESDKEPPKKKTQMNPAPKTSEGPPKKRLRKSGLLSEVDLEACMNNPGSGLMLRNRTIEPLKQSLVDVKVEFGGAVVKVECVGDEPVVKIEDAEAAPTTMETQLDCPR